jgi:predicted metal-dependent RNase
VPGVRVYLDGLTREVTRLFATMPKQLPSGERNQFDNGTDPFLATLVENWQAREATIRERKPGVILASSVMIP